MNLRPFKKLLAPCRLFFTGPSTHFPSKIRLFPLFKFINLSLRFFTLLLMFWGFLFAVFTKDYPARSAVQVAKLPLNAKVEIEVVAAVGTVKTICCKH